MKQRPRIFDTETDKALMWDHWQKGGSLHSIARLFDRHHRINGRQERAAPQGKRVFSHVSSKQMSHRHIPVDGLSRAR